MSEDANGTGKLKRGGIVQHLAAKAAREEERRGRAATRAGILEILREITADEAQSGAYRTAAARLLLMPEAETPEHCRYCGHCKNNRELPASVAAWLDSTADDTRRWQNEQAAKVGRCGECDAKLSEPPAPRTCASFHGASNVVH